MYFVSKRLEISIAHHLKTSYDKRCQHLHGHNAIVTIYCQSDTLNEDGMVIDFKKIKDLIMQKLTINILMKNLNLIPLQKTWLIGSVRKFRNAIKLNFKNLKGI